MKNYSFKQASKDVGKAWVVSFGALAFTAVNGNASQPGMVLDEQKISDTAGGFEGGLRDLDAFGSSVAQIGDVDGDGVTDLAVGALGDDAGGGILTNYGAVWILFLNEDGTVHDEQKITLDTGGFTGSLDSSDQFGRSITTLGDLDGDGIPDLAVGAPLDDDGGPALDSNRGAVWILFLNADGTVRDHQKISDTEGGDLPLGEHDHFGRAVASLGDLDEDGVIDVAAAAGCLGETPNPGCIWVLFLNGDGTVREYQKISEKTGGFKGVAGDAFGADLARLDDLDGDGVPELAVGVPTADGGGASRGGFWILFLDSDGTVHHQQLITDVEGGFDGELHDYNRFGGALAALEDLNGDDVPDLAVGAHQDNDGGQNHGAAWILFLRDDGTVLDEQKISDTEGGFEGELSLEDHFGYSVASLDDLDGDGACDIAVGALWDDDGGVEFSERGAVWILFLEDAECFADFDGSGAVGFADLLEVIDAWGPCMDCPPDLDGSDDVGFTDLLLLLNAWGPCE